LPCGLHNFPDYEDEIDEPSKMMKTRSMIFMEKIPFGVYASKIYSILYLPRFW